MEEKEHLYEKEVLCPFCDYKFDCDDMYGSEENLYEEGTEKEIKCPLCEKNFFVNVEIEFRYTTNTHNEYGELSEKVE